jgi:hypothetical protein
MPSKLLLVISSCYKESRDKGKIQLHLFENTEYLGIERDNIASLIQNDVRIIRSDIIEYITKLKNQKKYSYSSIKVMLTSIFLFFE